MKTRQLRYAQLVVFLVLGAYVQPGSPQVFEKDFAPARDGDQTLTAPGRGEGAVPRTHDQLLVTLANGQLLALDQDSGDVVWTFDTGAPLVASGNPAATGDQVTSPGEPGSGIREGIFPGTDGSLYVFRAGAEGPPRIEKLPLGVRDLVEASPAPTPDGSLVLGSQQSTVFVLDAAHGTLLRTLRGDDSDAAFLMDSALLPGPPSQPSELPSGPLEQGDSDGGEAQDAPAPAPKLLAIGRKDYVIRAVHPAFGEQWNVSWSNMQRLSALDIRRPDLSGGNTGGREHQGGGDPTSVRLWVGPDHSLRRFDPVNGWELWARKFDAPPLAAYPSAGPPIDLIEPVVTDLLPPAQPPAAVATPGSSSESVVVGLLGGGLYGMKVTTPGAMTPPPYLQDSASEQCAIDPGEASTGAGLCGANEGTLEGGVGGLNSLSDGADRAGADVGSATGDGGEKGTVGTAVALPPERQPWWAQAVCASEDSDTCAVPVGLFPVEEQSTDSTLLFLPAGESSKPNATPAGIGVGDGVRGRWRVLVLSAAGGAGVVVLLALVAMPPGGAKHAQQPSTTSQLSSQRQPSETQAAPKKPGGKSKKAKAGKVDGAAVPPSEPAPSAQGPPIGALPPRPPERDEKGAMVVGRLRVGPGILGYGSGGTIVFEGEMDGRQVAVKRLLRQFADLAKKEISALIVSDEHPNVVRCFALEEDAEFLYLALEKCAGTLADAVATPAGRRLFVSADGTPSPFALRVALDVGQGLEALHARGIVHRDLKPHNVLLTESGRAKLSDMGLSKRLIPEQASFETAGAGGSPGWQAPEQLTVRAGGSARQTAAVDVFSFGLLVHYCLTGGKHPYGEGFERDASIMHGRRNLDAVAHLPEAVDLLSATLAADPEARPAVRAAMAHPLWWPGPRRLAFLIDVSDRVEGEDRAEDATLYAALEALSPEVMGEEGASWAAKLDSWLINNLGKYRRYDYSSLRDLLRVVRNKHSHFRELPPDLQARMGPIPDGFLAYFQARFPRLLPSCFYFALRWCPKEPVFMKYFPPGAEGLLSTAAPPMFRDPKVADAALAAARARLAQQQQLQRSAVGGTPGERPRVTAEPAISLPLEQVAAPVAVVPDGDGALMAVFPRRAGAPVCDFYSKTGHCRYGEACRFDHPPEYAVKLNSKGLPIRPGATLCSFYERTGDCKFGAACKFHHPASLPGQPRRQSRTS